MSPSTSQPKVESHPKEVVVILHLLLCFNFFFAPVKDGLAPLVSVFLVVDKGWDAGSAGVVWFTRDIAALICQTFAGALIDRSEHKRLLLALATVAASVAATSMVFSQNFYFMVAKSVVEGVAISFIPPCKYSMILGLVGQEQYDQVVKANEMVDHAGSFVFIFIAGALSYVLYPDVVGLFYIIGGAGSLAFISLVLMPLSIKGDNDGTLANGSLAEVPACHVSRHPVQPRTRSRINQPLSRNLADGGEVKPWTSTLKDKNVVLFASSVFFFHFGNAAVLPLLSQVLALDTGRAGLPYTCANIAVAQLTSILAVWGMGRALESGVAYNIPLVIGYAFAVPVRCFLIVVLLKCWPNSYAMMATQLFDGIGAGIFGLSIATLTRALTAGTGRFSFTLGAISTVHMIGAALSNLVAGFIVDMTSYELAIISLGIMGIAPVFLGISIRVKDQEGESSSINSGSNTNIDNKETDSGSHPSDNAVRV